MGFIIRDCIRCPTKHVQMIARGCTFIDGLNADVFFSCQACNQGSIYRGQPNFDPVTFTGDVERDTRRHFDNSPVLALPAGAELSEHIPLRVRELFLQASTNRNLGMYDASGAMFRKAIDVATKEIFAKDERLAGKNPADAPRARIQALGQFKVLDDEIVELADVALVDGNDAVHDIDPYSAEEAEALEDLTFDLLDRIFVRPARIAAVRLKQIAAGQRKT